MVRIVEFVMSTAQMIQPLKIFQKLLGKNVIIRLKNNKAIRGILTAYDSCMNVVLDDAEEIDPKTSQTVVKYGRVYIRGNQILFISTTDVVLG